MQSYTHTYTLSHTHIHKLKHTRAHTHIGAYI